MSKTTTTWIALALLLVSTPALAGSWDHNREGFLIGFNAGGGGAALELKPTDGGTIASDREPGGAGNFRIGYAVRPNLTLALETNAWGKNENDNSFGTDTEINYRLNVVAFAVTWYPGAGGFYLRGGAGVGTGLIRAKSGGFSAEAKETGPGVLAAVGYEWRLGQRFALGPQLDLGGMNLGEVDTVDDDGNDVKADFTVNYVNLSVGLNWYW